MFADAVPAIGAAAIGAADVGETETGSELTMPPAIGELPDAGAVKASFVIGIVVPVGETPLVVSPVATTGIAMSSVEEPPTDGAAVEAIAAGASAENVVADGSVEGEMLAVVAVIGGVAVPEANGSALVVGPAIEGAAPGVIPDPVLDCAGADDKGAVVGAGLEAAPGCSSVPQTSQTTLSAGFIFSQAGQRTMPDAAAVVVAAP